MCGGIMDNMFYSYWARQKSWWRNMDNIIINYHHCGESYDMKFCHMNKKTRIDRNGCCYRCYRWR